MINLHSILPIIIGYLFLGMISMIIFGFMTKYEIGPFNPDKSGPFPRNMEALFFLLWWSVWILIIIDFIFNPIIILYRKISNKEE